MANLHEERELLEQMRGQIDEELFREKYGVTEEQAKELVEYLRKAKGPKEVAFSFEGVKDVDRDSLDDEIKCLRDSLFNAKADVYKLKRDIESNPLTKRVRKLEKVNFRDVLYTAGIIIALAVGLLL